MPTLALAWSNDTATAGLVLTDTGLATGDALTAAVLCSLFTDRRAVPDDRLEGDDPRGWWGDSYASQQIGSRLWLLRRSRRTTETLRRARDAILEALDWLTADGVVQGLDVLTEWTRPGLLGARITLTQRDGARRALTYQWAWSSDAVR